MNPPLEQTKTEKLKAAGFWIRLAAHGIDLSIVMMIMLPVSLLLAIRMAMAGTATIQYSPWWDVVFYVIVIPLLVLLWRTMQATPGKRLCGLVVVDAVTGEKASIRKLTIRSFSYILSSLPIIYPLTMPLTGQKFAFPLCFGFLWIFISKRNYGWHDIVSGAIVVEKATLPEGKSEIRNSTSESQTVQG